MNNFKKQLNHAIERVDNEITNNHWRPDLVIWEIFYSEDFLTVDLPLLSSRDNVQGYSHLEWKPILLSKTAWAFCAILIETSDNVEARAVITSPQSPSGFIALLQPALIASVLNLIPVDIQCKTIVTGACFCTNLFEKYSRG